MTRFSYSLAPLAFLAVAGCAAHQNLSDASGGSSVTAQIAPNEAEAFIKKSMDMYKGLHSFSTQYSWHETVGSDSVTAKRTFEFEAPNLYRAVTNAKNAKGNATLTSISDGKKVLETQIMNSAKSGQTSAAPQSLPEVSSSVMTYPVAAGTLLYKLFGGSVAYYGLVDPVRGQPSFGAEVKEAGENAKHVKFYGSGLYGHVDIAIGEKSFKVYEITFDSEPLMQQVAQGRGPAPIAKAVEKYTEIDLNPKLAPTQFVTVAPKDVTVVDADAVHEPGQPVVPLGSKAPEFKFTPLNGGAPVSLASLRGKPVLVDFWATWCGPCKASLPHTQAIYNDLKSKGLQVMVVSNEDAPKIKAFIHENRYTFPVFRDLGASAARTYKVEAIPSVLIIDKEGKLQNYFVGLQDESTLRTALKKVGVE